MHKNFFHDLLDYNFELMQGIIAFNMRKQKTMQVPEILDEYVKNSELNLDVEQLWSMPELWQKYAHETQFFWDFDLEAKRLALLNQETLQNIMLYMGVSLNATAITQCVAKADVVRLQECLGIKAFNFALHRGQFVLGTYNNALFAFLKNESLVNKIMLSGVFSMHFCIYKFPAVIYDVMWQAMQDFAKNFDFQSNVLKAYIDGVPVDGILDNDVQHLWFSMKKILLKEVAPQWKPYFSA